MKNPFISRIGADLTIPDFTGMSAFHLAIEEGATRCIAEAMRFLPKEIHQLPDAQYRSPIVHAIQMNNVELCTLLIQEGSDINEPDEIAGRTPVHYAAELANGTIVELLIRSGGVLDISDANGLTPVHIASSVESQEALNAITKVVGNEILDLADARGVTPLMSACLYGNETTVKLLLKKKVGYTMLDHKYY